MNQKQLQNAVQTYFALKHTSQGENKMTKEQRETRKQAETIIMNYMDSSNQAHLKVNDQWLIIKDDIKKQPINYQFLMHIYFQFRTTQWPTIVAQNLNKEQEAQAFIQWVETCQRKMGEPVRHLAVTKKKPMTAFLSELSSMPMKDMSGAI